MSRLYKGARCVGCGHYEFADGMIQVLRKIMAHIRGSHPHDQRFEIFPIPPELYRFWLKNPDDPKFWDFLRNARRYAESRLAVEPLT